jgi:hypothetical protein
VETDPNGLQFAATDRFTTGHRLLGEEVNRNA